MGAYGEPSRSAVLKSSGTTVLVLGASGFIGEHLARALEAEGHDVVCGMRRASDRMQGCRSVAIDYMRDHAVTDWLPRLKGVDVVINAVGILRETRSATFAALHVDAPIALFQACAEVRVGKIVQISALGADAQAVSRYHLSKKRADDALATSPIPWVVVQPSFVFGPGGAERSAVPRARGSACHSAAGRWAPMRAAGAYRRSHCGRCHRGSLVRLRWRTHSRRGAATHHVA